MPESSFLLKQENAAGWILFEDNHCLAFNKPPGLLTQGVPDGLPALEHIAREYLRARYLKTGRVYLGIPHRIDRPVSGVVLFTRSSKAAARVAEQFRERTVKKIYHAWLANMGGNEIPPDSLWLNQIRKVPDMAHAEKCNVTDPGAREAITHCRVLQRQNDRTLVELSPATGRMHQLRLQASLRGTPILGDILYGAGPIPSPEGLSFIALHARSLTFLHPIRYEPITLEAPHPPHFPPLQ